MTDRTELGDLLRPTLRDEPVPDPGRRPWRLSSQVYVAFFGGVIAVTVIAFLNAGRLGLQSRQRAGIAAVGVVGFAGVCVAAALMDESSALRLVTRGIALAAYGVMYLIQRSADRAYSYHSPLDADEEYDSLWGPGIFAVIGLGFLQFALLAAAGVYGG